ncbi:hypothetical protein SGPA1_50574 [Streptomyces misionensis JCM 4497]
MAVDQHPRQPARRLRGHLHGPLPHSRPRVLRHVRRSGRLAARAGRGRLRPRRRGHGRPARTAAHPARRPVGHRRLRRAARVHDRSGRHRRRRLPRRHGLQRVPARRAGDDGRHRAARGPGAGLLAQLLGHQPRLRRLLRGRRLHRRVQLSRRVPDRGRDDGRLRPRRLPEGPRVPAGRPGQAVRRRCRGRGQPGHRAARRPVHGRRRAVLPGRPDLPAGLGGAAGGHGPGRVLARGLRPRHRRQRRPDRGPADPGHPVHRAPRSAQPARPVLAAGGVRVRAHRLRRVGRRLHGHGVRVDPRRDRQRAHPDRARRTALPRARTRALPGHVQPVLVRRRAGRAADVRPGHRPVRGRVAVGDVRRRGHGRRARLRAADAGAAQGRPYGRGRGPRRRPRRRRHGTRPRAQRLAFGGRPRHPAPSTQHPPG